MKKSFASIVITGASSGIGEALAVDYAAPGIALALNGRDAARLEAVAAACRAKGATVDARAVEVTHRAALAAWLAAFDDAHPVDLIVANAGIGVDDDTLSPGHFARMRQTMAVNVDGVFNTVEPLVGRMMERRRGQIAVVSSLAGFIGLPMAASYNASKAAVRVWGESLRYGLKKHGVGMSVICPGFVATRINANAPFKMPFLMSSAQASAIIRRGLANNRPRIAFPLPTKAAVWLGSTLPGRWTARLLGA
jgi:short-subunit dehydrogenase